MHLQSQACYSACPWRYCTRYNQLRGFVRFRLVLLVHCSSRKWCVETISRSHVQARHNLRPELLELFIVSCDIHCALSDNLRLYDIEFKFLMFFYYAMQAVATDRLFLRTTCECHSAPKNTARIKDTRYAHTATWYKSGVRWFLRHSAQCRTWLALAQHISTGQGNVIRRPVGLSSFRYPSTWLQYPSAVSLQSSNWITIWYRHLINLTYFWLKSAPWVTYL